MEIWEGLPGVKHLPLIYILFQWNFEGCALEDHGYCGD